MNVFGVGPTELFLVLVVVLVLFGPERLPEIAKRIAGASREIRDNLNSLNDQMNNALETSMELDKARMTPPAETTTEPPVLTDAAPPDTVPFPSPSVRLVSPDENQIMPPASSDVPPPASPPPTD